MGGAATYARQSSAAAVISGDPMASPDEGANFTMVPEVESYNRGSGVPLAYAFGLSPPTSARRESASKDVSRSTMLTTCADSETQYVETHINLTDLTITKQSAQCSLNTARADIAHTKVRHTDLKVDSAEQSTYL